MNGNFYRQAMMESPMAYAYHKIICDPDGLPRDYEFIEVNAAFEAFTGLKGPDIIGRRITEIFPGIGEAEFNWVKVYGEVALHGGQTSFKQFSGQLHKWYGITVYSPEKYFFITYFVEVSDEKEYVTKIENLQKTAEATEILYRSELRQEEEALLTSRRQMSDIMDFLPDATLAIDREGRVIVWNKAIEKMTGIPASEMLGKGGNAYSIPFYGEARLQLMDLVYQDNEEIAARYSSIERDGNTLASEAFCPALYHGKGAWVYVKASPLHDRAGNIIGTIESIRDISRQNREKNLLETTLRSIGDGVISTDEKGVVVLMNRVAETLTGWVQDEAIGKSIDEIFIIINECTREKNHNIVLDVLESRETKELASHSILLSRDGGERPIEDSAAPIIGKNGEMVGAVLVFRDYSAKKQKQDEILFLSYHDYLTGLYNRRFYEEELMRLDTERNLPLSIVMGDVNGLKRINDTIGHLKGDELLVKAADLITKACRADDIVARLGGDEFVILLPKTSTADAEGLISRISDQTSEEEVCINVISISFGHATKNRQEEDILDVIKNAEDHMYRVKLTDRLTREREKT